ncbi:MAG: DUF2339 domain-containing protein [Spirochaetes bacterium]|nr:DUF2339 domain-containing protein [Spirochaetota bacterium]
MLTIIAVVVLFVRLEGARRAVAAHQIRLRQLEEQVGNLSMRAANGMPSPAAKAEAVPAPAKPKPAEAVAPVSQTKAPDPKPLPPDPVPPKPIAPPPAADRPVIVKPRLSLEQFLGVKLFAWVGAVFLFLGVVFFVKYSFEQGLISPELRIALGYGLGLALTLVGVRLGRGRYQIPAQALIGVGLLILYAVTMTAHRHYQFIGAAPAFALMALITVAAFLLSVGLHAPSVAILGMLGGFLTPPLLGSGEDRPGALFGYIALLDAGLLAVALRRRWGYLAVLAAAATIVVQWGWAARFFEPEKLPIAMAIYLGFSAFFGSLAWIASRGNFPRSWYAASFLPAVGALLFAIGVVLVRLPSLGDGLFDPPARWFAFLAGIDLLVIATAWRAPGPWRWASRITGLAVLFLFTLWVFARVSDENLFWALGFNLLLALLHTAVPLWREREEKRSSALWMHVFSLAPLALLLVPLLTLDSKAFLVWPWVLLLLLGVFALAAWMRAWLGVLIAFLVALVMLLGRIFSASPAGGGGGVLLGLVCAFALLFAAAAVLLLPRILAPPGKQASEPGTWEAEILPIAALSPFLLMAIIHLRLGFPSPWVPFGFSALLMGLFLAVSWLRRNPLLPLLSALGMLLVEWSWVGLRLDASNSAPALAGLLILPALPFLFPFLAMKRLGKSTWPWLASALVYPAHAYLIFKAFGLTAGAPWPGLLALALAILPVAGLAFLVKTLEDEKMRLRLFALFGGAALFFITLVFPLQFSKEWITLGWALEGAALAWWFTRVPHPGLKWASAALSAVVLIRLVFNPWVFDYHPRSGEGILNWYLYAYGVAAACGFFAARFLRGQRLGAVPLAPTLSGGATLLLFLLLNIEIANVFSTGPHLTFRFSGSLAQDMSTSLGWGLFATVLLLVGFRWRLSAIRWAGLGLLVLTLVKLFIHDLWRLGGLYRIGSLIGLAVMLISLSFLYQRFFLAADKRKTDGKAP